MKDALIVIDMQNDFIDGALGTKEACQMLPRLVAKLEKVAASKKQDLFFTRDTHHENYLSTQEGKKLPVPHCIEGTKGHELAPAILPFAMQGTVINKPTFGSAALPQYLAEYDRLELVGLCTDICVISNAMLLKTLYPEKTIAVDSSCCAGVTTESHKNALDAMKMCQIEVY